MSKDFQRRLIKAVKLLREPNGSTVPAIIQVIAESDPGLGMKTILQSLLMCCKKGLMTRTDEDSIRFTIASKKLGSDSENRLGAGDSVEKVPKKEGFLNPLPGTATKIKQKCGKPMSKCPNKQKAKQKKSCPKKKPKCPKSKPKCPKPRKSKPKSAKKKSKCPKAKPKPRCPKKKPKMQPSKKMKKCSDDCSVVNA